MEAGASTAASAFSFSFLSFLSFFLLLCLWLGSTSSPPYRFGIAVKLTFGGKNQFGNLSTYLFGLVSIGCILVQMNYLNKALDTFGVNM